MPTTIRPADLMADANKLSPVISAAQSFVTEQSISGIDADGASSIAAMLIDAARKAQRTLADVSKFPAGRRAEADKILVEAEQRYSEWRKSISLIETVYIAGLHVTIFTPPTGVDALIARQDAEQVLQRADMPLTDAIRALIGAGGNVAQLAVSPWLDLVATGRNQDAEEMRAIAQAQFIQVAAAAGSEAAVKYQAAPTAYAKLRIAMDKIASECLGVNRSAFAERALAWGSETPEKDAEIRALKAQLARTNATPGVAAR
ncbi:hypothetical protein [Streptomyces sp. NPDC127066]|uniref:hypothetical protein n=1 Tax=Streptomyces sp. NPDC127066 TaxID=3347125 RepID=UPI003650E221